MKNNVVQRALLVISVLTQCQAGIIVQAGVLVHCHADIIVQTGVLVHCHADIIVHAGDKTGQ